MPNQDNNTNEWELRTKKNTYQLRNWTATWVVTIFITAFGPKWLWDYNTLLSILAVTISVAFGIGMIIANIQHLKGMDELHQKIFLDASALTLGVGLVFGNTYSLLENIHLITFQPEIPHFIIVMGLTFLASIIAGHRRYQ